MERFMDAVLMTYPPEVQAALQKMADEIAKSNERPEPKPINQMYLWLDFYRAIIGDV